MKHSPLEPMNSTAIISAYEALRESVLTPHFSPFIRWSMKRLIADGRHAWIITLNWTPSREPARTSVEYSSEFTDELNESGGIVQLIASMMLQSLTEETSEYTE